VKEVLESCMQQLEQHYKYLAWGYDFDWLVGQAATPLGLDPEIVTRRGRYPDTVEARSVSCYWAARELGISTLELAKRLGVSQPTANQSVNRGRDCERKGIKAGVMIYTNMSVPNLAELMAQYCKRIDWF
jgi:putative transposase